MIQKKLQEQRETSSLNNRMEANAQEAKMLLDSQHSRDMEALTKLFPNSNNAVLVSKHAEEISIMNMETLYKGKVYTTEEIKHLCLKYRLSFGNSTQYNGKVDIGVLTELKELLTHDKLKYMGSFENSDFGTLRSKLFILAPREQFKRVPIEKKSISKLINESIPRDPAAFLKIDDNKYLFIREWGSDFTIDRRVLGALTARESTVALWMYTIQTLLVLMTTAAVFWVFSKVPGGFDWAYKTFGDNSASGLLVSLLIVIIACAVSIGIVLGTIAGHNTIFRGVTGKGMYSTRASYATEYSWLKE